jgi:spermidine synthase
LKRIVLISCFAASGASGLIYEVAWTRKLALVVGSTTIAVSICLAAYLGGLALGAHLFGRMADRLRRPAVAYAAIEFGIGAYALLSLPLISLLGSLEYWLAARIEISAVGSALLEALLAGGSLILPTILMGASLPALIRAVEAMGENHEVLGFEVGLLYSLNTFGGVAGAALAGFLLLPAAGLSRTVWIASACNLLLGTIVWSVFRGSVADVSGATPIRSRVPARGNAIGAVMFASGFASLLCEVVWTRSLEPIVGSSSWSFSIMLSTYLFGLASGIWSGGRLTKSKRLSGDAGRLLLACAQVLTALAVFAGLFVLGTLQNWFISFYTTFQDSPYLFLLSQMAITGSLFAAPAFFIGTSFPFAIEASKEGGETAASLVGRLYALNTAGTILGSLTGGLVLVPWIGLRNCFLVACAVSLVAGCAALGLYRSWSLELRLGGILALGIAGALAIVFAPEWDKFQMTYGVYYSAPTTARIGAKQTFERQHSLSLLYYREGRSATVSVSARDTRKILSIDGRTEASTNAATQIALGHLPFALGRRFENALVIGLGSGSTAGSLAMYDLNRIDVAELEPAVREAADYFSETNHDFSRNHKIHIYTEDGRAFLSGKHGPSYDLITSQPSVPWAPGAAKLFTSDFYRLVRSKLKPGGVYAQWFQLYNLEFRDVQSVLHTFASVFPGVLVLTVGRNSGEVVMFGSDQPLRLNWDAVDQLFATPKRIQDLAKLGIHTKGALLSRVLFGPAEMGFAKAKLNTDDNGLLEYSAIAHVYLDSKDQNMDRLYEASVNAWNYVDRIPEGETRRVASIQMGDAALYQGDYRRGYEYIQSAINQKESYETDLVGGDLLFKLNHLSAAAESWTRALTFRANDPLAKMRLVAYYKLLRPSQRPPEFAKWVASLPPGAVSVNDAFAGIRDPGVSTLALP